MCKDFAEGKSSNCWQVRNASWETTWSRLIYLVACLENHSIQFLKMEQSVDAFVSTFSLFFCKDLFPNLMALIFLSLFCCRMEKIKSPTEPEKKAMCWTKQQSTDVEQFFSLNRRFFIVEGQRTKPDLTNDPRRWLSNIFSQQSQIETICKLRFREKWKEIVGERLKRHLRLNCWWISFFAFATTMTEVGGTFH